MAVPPAASVASYREVVAMATGRLKPAVPDGPVVSAELVGSAKAVMAHLQERNGYSEGSVREWNSTRYAAFQRLWGVCCTVLRRGGIIPS